MNMIDRFNPKSVAVKIYHNPTCGTSRNTLALIRNAGIESTIVEYTAIERNTAGGLDVHFQQAGEGSVVLVSDKKVFPIAWRQAFISQQYLERIQKLEEQGLFKLALKYLGLAQSDRELLEEIRKEFLMISFGLWRSVEI